MNLQSTAAVTYLLGLGDYCRPGGGAILTDVIAPSGTLAFKANRQQMLALAEKRAILCEVTKKGALRFAALLVPVREGRRIAGTARGSRMPERLPVAEDNKTSVKEGRSYKHVAHRCSAYDENMPPIDALAV